MAAEKLPALLLVERVDDVTRFRELGHGSSWCSGGGWCAPHLQPALPAGAVGTFGPGPFVPSLGYSRKVSREEVPT